MRPRPSALLRSTTEVVTAIRRTADLERHADVESVVGGGLPAGERYEPRELLGEGGIGEVRLCLDRRIGRDVAMKIVLREHAARRDIRTRFVREARVQGQLEHPAIVPVYDLGTNEAGSLYFTMKRVRGTTLAAIIDQLDAKEAAATGAYTRHKLLTAFGQVCLAVDFAHSRGILHRDLRPANVMLGDFGEVYVLDWGLAKLGGDTRSPPTPTLATPATSIVKTSQGSIIGTPGYMAPEQLLGEVDRLDARTDVYALGAMLFEVLTLRRLHRGDSVAELHASTLRGAGPRESLRALTLEVPPELEAICEKATALDPKDRYASARELHEAVDHFLEGDRDVARRRAMATLHGRAAAEHAARATASDSARGAGGERGDGGETERARALREVGRALALDPANLDAMRTFVGLLTHPPTTVPEEVKRELLSQARAGQVSSMRAKVHVPVLAAITLAIAVTGAAFGPVAVVPALGVFAVMAFMMAKVRDRLIAAEQRHALQTWQLRQLVPSEDER